MRCYLYIFRSLACFLLFRHTHPPMTHAPSLPPSLHLSPPPFFCFTTPVIFLLPSLLPYLLLARRWRCLDTIIPVVEAPPSSLPTPPSLPPSLPHSIRLARRWRCLDGPPILICHHHRKGKTHGVMLLVLLPVLLLLLILLVGLLRRMSSCCCRCCKHDQVPSASSLPSSPPSYAARAFVVLPTPGARERFSLVFTMGKLQQHTCFWGIRG